MKKFNFYARLLGDLYYSTPKAVFAAIAVSHAVNATDIEEGEMERAARAAIIEEWRTLYMNEIVPQKPPSAGAGLERKREGRGC